MNIGHINYIPEDFPNEKKHYIPVSLMLDDLV